MARLALPDALRALEFPSNHGGELHKPESAAAGIIIGGSLTRWISPSRVRAQLVHRLERLAVGTSKRDRTTVEHQQEPTARPGQQVVTRQLRVGNRVPRCSASAPAARSRGR